MENTLKILGLVRKQNEENAKVAYERIIKKYINRDSKEILRIHVPDYQPDYLLFTLEVSSDRAITVVKELVHNNVIIINNESYIKIAVREASFEINNERADTILQTQKRESLLRKVNRSGDLSIDELRFLKDWKLIVDIAKRKSYENVQKSMQLIEILPEVLDEYIENEILRASKSVYLARSSVDRLTPIADNESLRNFRLYASMRKAGKAIIEMCKAYPKELVGELIFLANSRTTIPYINIFSFINFYQIINSDPDKYKDEILTATRQLNTWALDTVYLASVRLEPEDEKLFGYGIEFFKQKRKAV